MKETAIIYDFYVYFNLVKHFVGYTNIAGIKQIVFFKFYFQYSVSIRSLFVSIQFELDRIVCDRPNIAVT
jgi:hypothetical protein